MAPEAALNHARPSLPRARIAGQYLAPGTLRYILSVIGRSFRHCVEPPSTWDPLQLMLASIVKIDARPCDQHWHGG